MGRKVEIFDGNQVRVEVVRRSNSIVVFSFSGFKATLQDNPRYGESFLRGLDITEVYFIAKKDHWWQVKEMDNAIDFANAKTVGIANRVTYGQSMGAYGALLYADVLRARVIATAPQCSISKNEILHPVWKEAIDKYSETNRVISNNIDGVILFDDLDYKDRSHVNHLREISPRIRFLRTTGLTHYIPRALHESGVIKEVFSSLILNGDDTEIIRNSSSLIKNKKLASETYLYEIAKRLLIKKRNIKRFKFFLRSLKSLFYNTDSKLFLNKKIAVYLDLFDIYSEVPSGYFNGFLQDLKEDNQLLRISDDLYYSKNKDPFVTFFALKAINNLSISIIVQSDTAFKLYYKDSRYEKFSEMRVVSKNLNKGRNNIVFDELYFPKGAVLRLDPMETNGYFRIDRFHIS